MEAADLDDYLERTVRFDADGPTRVVPPAQVAVMAARTARSSSRRAAYSGYPPAQAAARAVAVDDPEMRAAVIGIWMVAAFLVATLGILVK